MAEPGAEAAEKTRKPASYGSGGSGEPWNSFAFPPVGQILADLLKVLGQCFRAVYDLINPIFETANQIVAEGKPKIKQLSAVEILKEFFNLFIPGRKLVFPRKQIETFSAGSGHAASAAASTGELVNLIEFRQLLRRAAGGAADVIQRRGLRVHVRRGLRAGLRSCAEQLRNKAREGRDCARKLVNERREDRDRGGQQRLEGRRGRALEAGQRRCELVAQLERVANIGADCPEGRGEQ